MVGRHRFERDRDQVDDDQGDDQPADDQAGAVPDRAMLQDLIKAPPELPDRAPRLCGHAELRASLSPSQPISAPQARKAAIAAASKPHSASAAAPPSPRSGALRPMLPGVREKRGAGAGCTTPSRSMKVARARLCGCA